MDYLTATTPRGFLHATTCDWPEGHGELFQAVMERQGLTVERYTMDQYREMRANPKPQPAPVICPPLPVGRGGHYMPSLFDLETG